MKLSRFLCSAAFCAVAAFGAEDPSRQAAQAMREGRYAEAERIDCQLLQVAAEDASLRLNLGLALHFARKYNEALKEFSQFL